jgi:hypothetical protein
MRWTVNNSEWHGWHTDAYPLGYDLAISSEETEKQKPRSCRPSEFSRSSAQPKSRRKRENASKKVEFHGQDLPSGASNGGAVTTMSRRVDGLPCFPRDERHES